MKSPAPDNFQRFIERYPLHASELHRLEKLIRDLRDAELRKRVHARVNVELGIVLLKNQEVGIALEQLFQIKLGDIQELRDFKIRE